jgi:hypothetical protein
LWLEFKKLTMNPNGLIDDVMILDEHTRDRGCQRNVHAQYRLGPITQIDRELSPKPE